MGTTKKILAISAAAALSSTTVLAEGLERSNLSPSILFEDGTYAEFSFGVVDASLPANGSAPNSLESANKDVAGDFTALGLGYKRDLNDDISLALTYTNQGNGVDIDWGEVSFSGLPPDFLFPGSPGIAPSTFEIAAELEFSTLALMGKYQLNENVSLLGGIKYVYTSGGALALGADTDNDPMVDPVGAPNITTAWDAASGSGFGYIIGAAYEIPAIALRAALTYESEIDVELDATPTAGAPVAQEGTGELSIGDALNLEFQTGIAENTLLFGNIRYSMWEDNQVFVPTIAGPQQVSTFEDGFSYSLGVARRLNDQWAISASLFLDPGDGEGASELAPQGENRSLTLGARYTAPSGVNIQFGATYSQRGDATTDNIGATLNDSRVVSAGVKVSKNF